MHATGSSSAVRSAPTRVSRTAAPTCCARSRAPARRPTGQPGRPTPRLLVLAHGAESKRRSAAGSSPARVLQLAGARSGEHRSYGLRRVCLDRDQLGDGVELGLLLDRYLLVVAENPDAVVDRLAGIILVAGLDAEEVGLEGGRELLR